MREWHFFLLLRLNPILTSVRFKVRQAKGQVRDGGGGERGGERKAWGEGEVRGNSNK